MFDEVDRDVAGIVIPRWGRVVRVDGGVGGRQVVDPDGTAVEPIRLFLLDFLARDNRPGWSAATPMSCWWRWLRAIGTKWDRATPSEARDLVLWLRLATKPRPWARTTSASTAGTINAVTRKRHLGDRYEVRTIRHNNAVLRSFYEFWIERGEGPLINPVRLDRGERGRPNAHHNPLEPFRAEGRIRYNPKLPKAKPRAMGDERCEDLFGGLRSHRDRAVLAVAGRRQSVAEGRNRIR